MSRGWITAAIASLLVAGSAFVVAAQSPAAGPSPGATRGKAASGVIAGQTAPPPSWRDLPRCEDPDRSESAWRSIVAATHLVPDGAASVPTDTQVEAIQRFLLRGDYKGWCHDFSARTEDKRVTGPFIDGKAYGTHSRVRVFYSKAVVDWLIRGRKGAIPDGAMIVKTMYATPATIPACETQPIAGYAVMVRSARASHDGWLWILYYVPGNQSYGFEYLTAQYGASFCLSCHAQTSDAEMTFADLSNLTGRGRVTYVDLGDKDLPASAARPGAPPPPSPSPTGFLRTQRKLIGDLIYRPLSLPLLHGNADLQAMLARPPPGATPQMIPWEAMPEDLIDDHVVPRPANAPPRRFATSDACVGCHDASDLLNNVPPRMTVDIGKPVQTALGPRTRYNLSPYGEWSASLMSQSSRDPTFRAQYEAELADVPAVARGGRGSLYALPRPDGCSRGA